MRLCEPVGGLAISNCGNTIIYWYRSAAMRAFRFNLRHLRALAATAQVGSVSGAATLVNLSQPAVTQGIAKLEALTGMALFDRRPDGMVATDAGRLLAMRANLGMAALAEGFQVIRRTGGAGFAGAERLVTMTQVRAMLSLASAGSFVAAARATSLSQPSLHRAVRDVERLSGASLVERKGRGVALTAAGLRVVRAFRLAIGEIESGLDELAGLSGGDSGTIRIGAMPLARARLLPVATARFHAEHPTIKIEIVEGSHAELIEPLRDGRVDFLIGALRFPDPGPDVVQRILFEDRLVVVAGRDHPLAGLEPSLEQLASFPWVMAREGTPLRREWEAMFTTAGLSLPQAPITCGSVMAIRTLLSSGEFLTLLSPEQVRLEIAWGVLTAIGKPIEASRRPIGLTLRRDWHPTLMQTTFLKGLETCAKQTTLPEIE